MPAPQDGKTPADCAAKYNGNAAVKAFFASGKVRPIRVRLGGRCVATGRARVTPRATAARAIDNHWQSLAISGTQRAPGPKTATIATSPAELALSVCVCMREQHLEATPGQSAAAAAKAAADKAATARAAADKAAADKAEADKVVSGPVTPTPPPPPPPPTLATSLATSRFVESYSQPDSRPDQLYALMTTERH